MEVCSRYVEQLETTVETIRRRFVSIYDMGVKVGQRSLKLGERAIEVTESTAYDFRDQLVQACNDQEPLNAQDHETRNSLVELYLGISVLLIGLGAGQLSGSSILGPLLARIFDPFQEFLLVFMLPVYVYLSFRKNAALDETERRVWLFGLSFAQGALLGHLVGPRLVKPVPAIFFLLPLVFALLTDYEISPAYLYSKRSNLLAACALIGGGLSVVGSSIAMGVSIGSIVITLAHLAILFAHFQLVVHEIKHKTYGVSEAQLLYVTSLLAVQIVISYLLVSGGSYESSGI
ncbi:hypothetical protein M3Y97_00595900 [Aphelenchoides bicaudatus]|nr:hypothetical protein M3Y97_00595900 [Aphelenchoides bicaudatus]